LHHKGKNCDIKQTVEELNTQYRRASDAFFSDKFTITGVNTAIRRVKKPNGGWADPRDMQLCKSFFQTENSTFSLEEIVL
jgi:hypothetical protein